MFETIFIIINFAIRCALVIYVLNRYIKPWYRSYLSVVQAEQEKNTQLQASYKQECLNIQLSIAQDEKLYADLEASMLVWHNDYQKRKEQKEMMVQRLCKRAQLNAEFKQEALRYQKTLEYELPMLLNQAVEEIKKEYEQDAQALNQYYDTLLKRLK